MISISHGNKDEWSGFADLLANLIEKYAAVLDLDNLPEPPYSLGGKESVNNLEHSEDGVENTETARYNYRVIDVQTRCREKKVSLH